GLTGRRIAVELNEEIVKLGQAFARNTRDDVREILLDSPVELDGLPGDWKAKHVPGDDGKIHVTTQYPDYYPIMTYARAPDVRERLYREFKNRGYPQNIAVLSDLIAKRYELARLLGYPNWAAYATEDKMIGSAVNAASFIDRISQVSRQAAERDYAVLLDRKRDDFPVANTVEDWEKGYYENRIKTERYAFDPQSVRPYFNFRAVQRGLFDLTGRLFGVTYRQVHGLKLWHKDVTAWDVYEGERQLGRFYLDLHPRPDKYGHAAQFDYRTGIAGRRLPHAVLVC
ncbi:MAG: peptidase M3, partial [Planctomycetes bacterium]|nr:peptidase M3 [Planctomycetota bacterium]